MEVCMTAWSLVNFRLSVQLIKRRLQLQGLNAKALSSHIRLAGSAFGFVHDRTNDQGNVSVGPIRLYSYTFCVLTAPQSWTHHQYVRGGGCSGILEQLRPTEVLNC